MQKKEEQKKSNEYLGFSLFNDVSNKRLQAYNRCAIVSNLKADGREGLGKEYLGQFTDNERTQILAVAIYAQQHGYEQTLREVQQSV